MSARAVWWWKLRRWLAILRWRAATVALARRWLLEPRRFRARTRWAVAKLAAATRPQRGLGTCWPSEVVAKLAMPTAAPVGSRGRVGTWSQDRSSIQRRPSRQI